MGVKKSGGIKKSSKKSGGKNESWGKKKWGGVNVRKEISLATTQFVDVTANMALEVMHMASFLEGVFEFSLSLNFLSRKD